MADHAFLPPSGASSWSQCAMWPKMNAHYPQPDSAEATEGTAAHWAAWEILAGHSIGPDTKAPNGMIVTDEMIEGGELLVDTIKSLNPRLLAEYHLEQPLSIFSINKNCFGTPDYWSYHQAENCIKIIDYKFGHRFVDEYRNPQGFCYLAGIVDFLCAAWGCGPGTIDQLGMSVSFTVVQPRCFYKGAPVRTDTFKLSEARPHFNKLANMAEASTLPNPTATTNDHCGDCPGRHVCPALQQAAYADAEYSNARTPVELSPLAAALELRLLMRALQRLEARVEGLKELTINNIRAGKSIPYFHVDQGFGRVQWTIPDGQIIEIGKMFGQDLSKPGVLTPSQAKKLGIPESIVKSNSFVPSTSFKLVPENPTDAPKVFGKTEG